LLDDLVVSVVLLDDKVPVIPLKVMDDDIDLTRVSKGEGIQPFEKISHAVVPSETKGSRIVFGFGDHQIGYMMFLGLHGLDVEEHVDGWKFFFINFFSFFLLLIGSQGLETCDSTPVWREDLLDVDVCVLFSVLGFLER